MIYASAENWLKSPNKSVAIFAMSGLGKTYLSAMLRAKGSWFHYSVDYRIGTRYMGEHIVDNYKKVAMKDPFLADLLKSDSLYIASNITFENLAPLSTYLGKPGDPDLGGIEIEDYKNRQRQHHIAEVNALLDTPDFIAKARNVYGYDHFVCDTGGSICEVVDANSPDDRVLKTLSNHTLMVWIEGTDAHTNELVRRFDKAPKPMCYQPKFLEDAWTTYLSEFSVAPNKVNPDDFVRWTYARAMEHRQPLYASMAKWGVTISAEEAQSVSTVSDFENLIAIAIERKNEKD